MESGSFNNYSFIFLKIIHNFSFMVNLYLSWRDFFSLLIVPASYASDRFSCLWRAFSKPLERKYNSVNTVIISQTNIIQTSRKISLEFSELLWGLFDSTLTF